MTMIARGIETLMPIVAPVERLFLDDVDLSLRVEVLSLWVEVGPADVELDGVGLGVAKLVLGATLIPLAFTAPHASVIVVTTVAPPFKILASIVTTPIIFE
jgi:hypothetical protein